MPPANLTDFFVAAITASASFIGLLFVAMPLITDKRGKDAKQIAAENILAESSYTSLLNIFFISLVALIPKTTIGYVTVVVAFSGLSNSVQLIRRGSKKGVSKGLLGVTTLVYLFEFGFGVYVIARGNRIVNEYIIMTVFLFLFGSALGRAWELTGVQTKD